MKDRADEALERKRNEDAATLEKKQKKDKRKADESLHYDGDNNAFLVF